MRSTQSDVLQPIRIDLDSAIPGSFALNPEDGMLADLRRDDEAMSGVAGGRKVWLPRRSPRTAVKVDEHRP